MPSLSARRHRCLPVSCQYQTRRNILRNKEALSKVIKVAPCIIDVDKKELFPDQPVDLASPELLFARGSAARNAAQTVTHAKFDMTGRDSRDRTITRRPRTHKLGVLHRTSVNFKIVPRSRLRVLLLGVVMCCGFRSLFSTFICLDVRANQMLADTRKAPVTCCRGFRRVIPPLSCKQREISCVWAAVGVPAFALATLSSHVSRTATHPLVVCKVQSGLQKRGSVREQQRKRIDFGGQGSAGNMLHALSLSQASLHRATYVVARFGGRTENCVKPCLQQRIYDGRLPYAPGVSQM